MDYYKVLGISRDANNEQIKKAFKSMALKHHPDKTGNESDTFKIINEAYQILSDPKKKEMYDITLTVSEGAEKGGLGDGGGGAAGNEMLSKLISMMFDFLKSKVQEKFKKTDGNRQNVKKKISLNINIDMDDIYHGRTRKINVKVKRGGEFETVSIYICFIDFKPEYVFEGMGDDMEDGERGDICVKVNITNNKGFTIDQLLDSSDIIYQPEIDISLYELYYGKDIDMDFFGTERLTGKVEFEVNKPLVHVIKDKGALYTTADDEVKRGNVYLYFKLKLPDVSDLSNSSRNEFENILIQYFK